MLFVSDPRGKLPRMLTYDPIEYAAREEVIDAAVADHEALNGFLEGKVAFGDVRKAQARKKKAVEALLAARKEVA